LNFPPGKDPGNGKWESAEFWGKKKLGKNSNRIKIKLKNGPPFSEEWNPVWYQIPKPFLKTGPIEKSRSQSQFLNKVNQIREPS